MYIANSMFGLQNSTIGLHFSIFSNVFECFRMRPFNPPRMAPIGLKLWENAFQTIPDVSLFDVEKNCSTILFNKNLCFFLRFFVSWLDHRKNRVWNTGDVVIGTQETSWLEQKRGLDWTTRDVLIATHEMSWLAHRRCLDWNTRDVLVGSHKMSWLE